MTNTLHVATRKGLFTLVPDPATSGSGWKIDRVGFLGQRVTMVLHDARDGSLFAALDHEHFGVKLHRSKDGGQNWKECAVPVYPGESAEKPKPEEWQDIDPTAQKGSSLSEIWALETGGPDQPNLIWAGTIPGGLFRSNDSGESWELIHSLWDRPERKDWFGGGKDQPGIHSICVDPRDSQHVTVGVSCGGVWVTRDGGETWACQADGMWAEYMPPERRNDPNIQDAHRLANCIAAPDVFWVQHHNGIFRSIDDCQSWQEVKDVKPSTFGFAVAVHPSDPETAWFVPAVKDECRVPVDGRVVVTRTRDGGQNFDVLSDGLPQEHAYDIAFRHALDISQSAEWLAIGSSTGNLWLSDNGGDSWQCISSNLPQIYCVRFANLW